MADDKPTTGAEGEKIPAELKPYIEELRGEAKSRRLALTAAEEKLANQAQMLAELQKKSDEQSALFKTLAGVKPEDTKTDPIRALHDTVADMQKQIADAKANSAEKDAKARKASILGELKAKVAPLLAEGVDLSVPLKLVDESKLSVDEQTLEVTGADEAIAELQKIAPTLFGKSRRALGTPGGGNSVTTLPDESASGRLKAELSKRMAMGSIPGMMAPDKKGTMAPAR
jgi:hypothetical protein